MIDKKIIKTICNEFDLGELINFEVITQGAINEKCKIITDKGSFFLKVIEGKPDAHLSYVSSVEDYMASRGVPAVCMLKTKGGSKWLRIENTQYTVYPYIVGDTSHEYSLEQYEAMGELLAKMHLAGSQGVPKELFRNAYKKLNKQDGLFFSTEKRDEIKSWPDLQDDDRKFLEYLEYKINLIPIMNEGSTHERDTIIHSDFHRDNIIFDGETKKIIGICDWERSHYGSRVSDIARSLVSCFSKGYVYEKAIENAKAMLKGYMREYPITKWELESGFHAHACLGTFVPWMEERYYNKNKKDAIDFIEHERELVKLCIEGKILNDLMV